jgi:CBS domain-containing protein
MEVLDRVSAVLKQKGAEVWSIAPDATVYEALGVMADKEIGALLVIDSGELVGLFSERDYARKVILHGRSSRDTRVNEVMAVSPRTIHPDCPVNQAMKIMTENRVRHLPVTSPTSIAGLISIGDLVKWIITTQDQTIEQLHSYIAGGAVS